MPRSNLPEQMRMNATRSRCALSMLAWIFRMKPLKGSSAGATAPSLLTRGVGCGRELAERVEERREAEVVHRAAEEHGRHLAREEALRMEGVARVLEQLGLFTQALVAVVIELASRLGRRCPSTSMCAISAPSGAAASNT